MDRYGLGMMPPRTWSKVYSSVFEPSEDATEPALLEQLRQAMANLQDTAATVRMANGMLLRRP